MKVTATTALLTGLAAAHSGVWNVEVDGNLYPALDTRMDRKLGAKRVEWNFKDSGVAWAPIPNVNDQGMACGSSATFPALKAVARAGAKVTVQWSGIVRTHYGPTMSYLAAVNPSTPATRLSFFKIHEMGWNPEKKLWANEVMIANDRKNSFQLPSDIKPGLYTLRTELLSMHYGGGKGPQFYPHCFNIMINGTGTATPPGVVFPGAYKMSDPNLANSLYDKGGKPLNWANFKIPGPAKYAGKYEAPTGPKPVVSDKERGVFPPEFQVKYDSLKKREDAEALAFNDKLNAAQKSLGHNEVKSESNLMPAFAAHAQAVQGFEKELTQLRNEAKRLGIAS